MEGIGGLGQSSGSSRNVEREFLENSKMKIEFETEEKTNSHVRQEIMNGNERGKNSKQKKGKRNVSDNKPRDGNDEGGTGDAVY